MKAVILAGGFGTRLSEETDQIPKPMVKIGGWPIIWHIMKIYSAHGVNDFVICAGYKGYVIKEFFNNYHLHTSDIKLDLASGSVEVLKRNAEPWRITIIDTGHGTQTGGRLKRISSLVDDTFCMTYGDGLSDINICKLVEFHQRTGKKATLTAVQQPGRFGALNISDNGDVECFTEKPIGDGTWVSGGYFVLEPEIFEYIEGDGTIWEQGPLVDLANTGELSAYKHDGYWAAMDTLREKRELEALWESGDAPWRKW